MWRPIQFGSFDLRVIVRLVAVLLAWKLLSTDFSAFPLLIAGPTIYHHELAALNDLTELYRPVLFASVAGVYVLQFLAAGLLLIGAWRLTRSCVLLGVLGVLLLEWNAYHYRGIMFEFEVPLMVLSALALWPVPWNRLLADDKAPSSQANLAGRFLVTLVGTAYFLCGLSKPLVDLNWHTIVNLHQGRSVMLIHFTMEFPSWVDPFTRWLEQLFREYPTIDHLAALSACLVEMVWITCVVSGWCRRIVPWLMVAVHAGIFLSMGILFLPFTLTALIVVQPWRLWLGRREAAEPVLPPSPSEHLSRPAQAVVVALAALLVALPAVTRVNFQPLVNYNLFGFRYGNFPDEVYRLGYQDPTTGRCLPLPQNHGGFMDYRLVTNVEPHIKGALEATDPKWQEHHLRLIRQFQRTLRPLHSERWLLGPFALPPHVVARAETMPADQRHQLRLLRGRLEIREGTIIWDWEDLGPIPEPKGTW